MYKRPKIEVPITPLDIIVDVSSAILLLLLLVYTAVSYSDLPETIPTHFNARGEADGYGNRLSVWGLPALGLVLFVGLFSLNKYPHLHNYRVNITEENALKNYRFSTRIVRFANFFCLALFTYIQYQMVMGAHGKHIELGAYFLPIVVVLSIVLPVFLIIYQQKINKN